MTDSETLTAIAAGFAAEGYNTPEKITSFVQVSVRQVKLIVGQGELQLLTAEQGAAQTIAQAAREAKIAEINRLSDSVGAIIRALAQGQP